MRKSDKKIDNQLRTVLTRVCEEALKSIDGFQWLTHTVNYTQFPESLKVVCVFDSNDNLNLYQQSEHRHSFESMIADVLVDTGIKKTSLKRHLAYDTEENCERQHQGNWALRLNA